MFPGKPCNCHVYRYLEYAQDIICDFLKSGSVSEVLFVPYALRDQVKGETAWKLKNIEAKRSRQLKAFLLFTCKLVILKGVTGIVWWLN